jgi:hypothetical protein
MLVADTPQKIDGGRRPMFYRGSIAASLLAAAFVAMMTEAFAFDETKYPDLRGEWRRGPLSPAAARARGAVYDPSKGWGPAQQAPLTPEYQVRFEVNLADQAAGGQGILETYACVSPGMPRVTNAYGPTEFIVTPNTTHILVENIRDSRRIFTDGRDWPAKMQPSLLGYSIGRWIDTNGDGNYDWLEVETRGFTGPRAYDSSGIPLHDDNQSVVKETIYLDKSDPNTLIDEVTVIDNALTRPWSTLKSYRRQPVRQPMWTETACGEANNHVQIGKEHYMISGDGLLMPTKRGQQPPDLKYFMRSGK